MGFGWGSTIGKIFDWIPGRKESRRNKIEKIKREIYEIQNKHNFSVNDSRKLESLASKLREYESESKNS